MLVKYTKKNKSNASWDYFVLKKNIWSHASINIEKYHGAKNLDHFGVEYKIYQKHHFQVVQKYGSVVNLQSSYTH